MDGGLTLARPLRADELRALQFLADIDLEPGEAALFSGGAVILYIADDLPSARYEAAA